MSNQDVSRRTLLKGGGAALAGLTVLRVAGPAHAFPGHPGQQERVPWDDDASLTPHRPSSHPGGQVIPWLDQPPPNPVPQITGNLLQWEELDSFLTPADEFFYVQHYGQPDGLDEAKWRVGIDGLRRPSAITRAGGPQSPPSSMKWISPWNARVMPTLHRISSSVALALPAGAARGSPRSSRRLASWTTRRRSCSGERIAAR